MRGLADIVVHHLCFIAFSSETYLDPRSAMKEMENWASFFTGLSKEEKSAASDAAQRTLDYMMQPPDGYGYTTVGLVTDENASL